MTGYDLMTLGVVAGLLAWSAACVTRAGRAHAHLARRMDLDDELLVAVGEYVHQVILPDVVCRAALRQPDDEKTAAGKKLVERVAACCAHRLDMPHPLEK